MAWIKTLTDVGAVLIASAFGASINYTRVKFGNGSVAPGSLADQTDVTGYVKDISIISLSAVGSTSTIKTRLDNIGISAETPLTQIGLFASVNGGAETLLMIYQTDTPSTVPTPAEQPGWIFEPQLDVVINGAANFTATIDWGAYAQLSDIQDAVDVEKQARIAADQTLEDAQNGCFAQLATKYPLPTTARNLTGYGNTINIYVDPAGDDANWGEDAAHPVKTVARARNVVQMCEGTGYADILFANGDYDINSGVAFLYPRRMVTLRGISGDIGAVNLKVYCLNRCLSFRGIKADLNGLTITKCVQDSSAAGMIHCDDGTLNVENVIVNSDVAQSSGSYAAFEIVSGKFYAVQGTVRSISNFRRALYAQCGSFALLSALSGSNNNEGYFSAGSIIISSGSKPGATTPTVKTIGGQISDNGVWI